MATSESQNKYKILHITNWYPNPWHRHEGVFIKNQFDAFSKVTDSIIINIQSRKSDQLFSVSQQKYNNKEEAYFVFSSLPWQIAHEIFTTILLIWVLIRKKANTFDLIHIHIAYPLLSHYWLWKNLIKIPIIISEHWSAYHYHFYLPPDSKKLNRIKLIFKNRIPVLTVSKSLIKDILKFSGCKNFKHFILPNILENCFLNNEMSKVRSTVPVFFTVNLWRDIKNPFPMLEAFARMSSEGVQFKLLIGGYGPLLEKMTAVVDSSNLFTQTHFLGKMSSAQILENLVHSDAYLFSSDYETFSVACAQALCTGTPLIGPHIDAIAEYAGPLDWKVVGHNDEEQWYSSLLYFMENRSAFISKDISERAREKFKTENISKQYLEIIDDIIHEKS